MTEPAQGVCLTHGACEHGKNWCDTRDTCFPCEEILNDYGDQQARRPCVYVQQKEAVMAEPIADCEPEARRLLDLWWHVLRPDRKRIAAEIERTARRYRRGQACEAADALEFVAQWLRATAGEVDDQGEPAGLDVFQRLAAEMPLGGGRDA